MSLRTANTTNLAIPGTQPNRRSLSGQTQPVVQAYARPADWVTIGTSTATQYVQLLVPVWNVDSNYIAFTTTGATTIDWGDGTAPENVASNVQANHTYVYANVSNLSSRGYRQAVITITPQAGQNITAFSINKRNTAMGSITYTTPILDMTLKVPNLVTTGNLVIGSASLIVNLGLLEQVTILSHGLTSMAGMFNNCTGLKSIPLFDTASVTDMTLMFQNCYKLPTVPTFNTANVTTMSNMFVNCYNLLSVPLFNTSKVTDMTSFVNSCKLLLTVPLFDTRQVTNMSYMFQNCTSLITVPAFNTTSALLTTGLMFNGCASLQSVPLFNTSGVTDMQSMFSGCTSLTTVPLFDTGRVTNMVSMFQNCTSLISVPTFNTSTATTMATMFGSCPSLQFVPTFDTSKVTTMSAMFSSCFSLQTITFTTTTSLVTFNNVFTSNNSIKQMLGANGPFNISSVNSINNTFSTCPSLNRCQITGTNLTVSFAGCSLGATELNEIFYGLSATGAGKTITITNNPGAATCTRSIATAKGWAVSG